jgi:hypothetical protein
MCASLLDILVAGSRNVRGGGRMVGEGTCVELGAMSSHVSVDILLYIAQVHSISSPADGESLVGWLGRERA